MSLIPQYTAMFAMLGAGIHGGLRYFHGDLDCEDGAFSRENFRHNGLKILRDTFTGAVVGAGIGVLIGVGADDYVAERSQTLRETYQECVENAPAGKTVVYTPPGLLTPTACHYE